MGGGSGGGRVELGEVEGEEGQLKTNFKFTKDRWLKFCLQFPGQKKKWVTSERISGLKVWERGP